MYQVKLGDVPAGKLRDKGVPIDNLSKFDGTKEEIRYLVNGERLYGQTLLFATKEAAVKRVSGAEFCTNNRMVAATKLQEGDEVAAIEPVREETDVILQTDGGVFLRFPLEEIPAMKKASRGVRGIHLNSGEKLEKVYLLGDNPVVEYKGKNVHLNRLKVGKRDGKGSRVRL